MWDGLARPALINNNNKRIACYCACNKARTQAAARCAGGCSYFFVAELQGAYWVVTQFGGVGGPRCSRPIPEKQNPHQNYTGRAEPTRDES